MKKVLIFGNSGSGKSTLAENLGAKLEIPVYHLDVLALNEHWKRLPEEEVVHKVQNIVAQKNWIIDGHYRRLLYEERLKEADTIIMLDLPLHECLFRCIKRVQASKKGIRRIGAYSAQIDKMSFGFLCRILWLYPRKLRPGILQKMENEYKEKVIYLRSQKEIDEFLKAQ